MEKNCSFRVTNSTLEDQWIDPDDGRSSINISIPQRIRNISVDLTDINYNVNRINLVRERTGKVYFYATAGASQIFRG